MCFTIKIKLKKLTTPLLQETILMLIHIKYISLILIKTLDFSLDSASTYYKNYFIGNKDGWVNNVKTYKRYTQKEIYDGIDLVMFSVENKLKYELHLQPNAE